MQANGKTKAQKKLFLNTAEAAKYMGIATGTLYNMRGKGSGPDYIRCKRLIRYTVEDIREWMDQHKVYLFDNE